MTPLYHPLQPAPIPNTPGIYRITCLASKKFYIGSSVNLQKRREDHFSLLRRKIHPNPKMQHAWNKYGEQSFTFEVLELVLLPELLTAREQHWFDTLNPFGHRGFNIAPVAGSNLGMKASPETIEKLKASHLGQPGYWTGKKRSPETNAKMSASKLGKSNPRHPGYTHSAEHREKLRKANLGKKQSEETRRKVGNAHRGKPRKPETTEKIRLANLGRKNSPEAIARMVNAHSKEMKTLIVTAPDGTEYTIQGVRQFCKAHNLDPSTLMRVAKGFSPSHKGWKARFPE